MKRKRRLRPATLLVVAGVLCLLGIGAQIGATAHVRHVTGVREVAHTNCVKCHGGGAQEKPQRRRDAVARALPEVERQVEARVRAFALRQLEPTP